MSIERIDGFSNLGPYGFDLNLTFDGILKGKLIVVDKESRKIFETESFDGTQNVSIKLETIKSNTVFSIFVADEENEKPLINGNFVAIGKLNYKLSYLQKEIYSIAEIYKIDANGVRHRILVSDAKDDFVQTFEQDSEYEIKLKCKNEIQPCVDRKIVECFNYSSLSLNSQIDSVGSYKIRSFNNFRINSDLSNGIGPFDQKVKVHINGTLNGGIIIGEVQTIDSILNSKEFDIKKLSEASIYSNFEQTSLNSVQIEINSDIKFVVLLIKDNSNPSFTGTVEIIPNVRTTSISNSNLRNIGTSYITDERSLIRIYRSEQNRKNRTIVYSANASSEATHSIQAGYIYEFYVGCNCSFGTVMYFTAQKDIQYDLSNYRNASNLGISDGTRWRFVDVDSPFKYFEGTVMNGMFQQLPSLFKPFVENGKNSRFELQIGCDDVYNPEPEPDFPSCEVTNSPEFTSGKSVSLVNYRFPDDSTFGLELKNMMTWSFRDVTHGKYIMHGVYFDGKMYETSGDNLGNVINNGLLRRIYTSEYEETTTYRFEFGCDFKYPGVNYYIVGFCTKRATDIEGSGNGYPGAQLGKLFVVDSSQLYGSGIYYNDMRMVVLNGPYDVQSDAESYMNSHERALLDDLVQQCQNRATLVFEWEQGAGCDLDIAFELEGQTYGWNHTQSGTYGYWYQDDTTCDSSDGAEKVSVYKDALIRDGKTSTTIKIKAHWYGSKGNGYATLTVSNGDYVVKRRYYVNTQESSDSNYDYLGDVTLNLYDDTIVVTGGEEITSTSNSNSLLSMLPEDLR